MNRACLVVLLIGLLQAVAGAAPEGPFSDLKFEEASKKAATEGKIVLIDFYTTWCGPCKMLDRNTWSNEQVIKLLKEKTIPLKLDAEKELKLAEKYKIEAYPTVLLLKPDGEVIDRLVGYRPPEAFMKDFEAALSGKDAVARARDAVAKAGGKDPMTRMQLARAMAEKSDDAGALKEYLWCYDHGAEADPSFAGVRLSFLLSDIASLGSTYAPAMKALAERRDQALARVKGGAADLHSVMELTRLNEALEQTPRTLEVFDGLPQGSPARAMMRSMIVDQLLEAGRYKDVLEGVDPLAQFDQQVKRTEQVLAISPAGTIGPDEKRLIRGFAVEHGMKSFQALAGLKRDDEALKLAAKIEAFDDSPKTRELLLTTAGKAGNPALAEKLRQRQ